MLRMSGQRCHQHRRNLQKVRITLKRIRLEVLDRQRRALLVQCLRKIEEPVGEEIARFLHEVGVHLEPELDGDSGRNFRSSLQGTFFLTTESTFLLCE